MKSWFGSMTVAFAALCSMACSNTPVMDDVVAQDAAMETGTTDAAPELCYRYTQPMMQPFCPASTIVPPLAQNQTNPNFVLTQIDIQQPASLRPTTAVGRLLNTAVAGSRFMWGLQLDLAAMTMRTGTLSQMGVMAVEGEGTLRNSFGFLMGSAPNTGDGGMTNPNRWDPVTGMVTLTGESFTSVMVPLVTVPVFNDDTARTLLAELPLRNTVMRNVQMNNMRGCVGLARYQYSSCLQGRWYTTDPTTMMPYGVLEADLTVADALAVPIPSLMGNLCQFIAGMDCSMVPMAMWPNPPDGMVMGQPAWHIVANFAAITANIRR